MEDLQVGNENEPQRLSLFSIFFTFLILFSIDDFAAQT